MVAQAALQVAAGLGFLVAVGTATAAAHQYLPRAYPRERTRLDPRTYRVVRGALAVGLVVGGLGAALSLVDTVGTIGALEASRSGLLAGVALLVPAWLGPAMVKTGIASLVGGAALAGAVEFRNARRS